MRIMIDGYNLSLSKGTGISTYARNLTKNIKSLGWGVDILYGISGISSVDDEIKEIAFFDQREHLSFWEQGIFYRSKKLFGSISAFLGLLKAKEIPISGVVETKHFSGRLPEFDKIYSIGDLFFLANLYFKVTGKLLKISMENPPDVMHWTYPIPVYLKGAKNVYTLHDLVPIKLPYTTLDNKKFYYKMCKAIVRESDKVVTVSENSKNDICQILNISPSKVVNTYQTVSLPEKYTSIPLSDVKTKLSSLYDVNYKEYILFVGAVEPKKNIPRMLEAYLTSNIQSPLIMVGPDGWMSDAELALINDDYNSYYVLNDSRLSKKRRVRRLNYVPFSALVNLIRGAKFLVFPSLYEGFGLPVLESMLLNTPVLTSNTSCIPEVAGDAAVLIDPYDVESIKEGMLLLDGMDSGSMSDECKLQADKFSSDVISEKLKEMYLDITK